MELRFDRKFLAVPLELFELLCVVPQLPRPAMFRTGLPMNGPRELMRALREEQKAGLDDVERFEK